MLRELFLASFFAGVILLVTAEDVDLLAQNADFEANDEPYVKTNRRYKPSYKTVKKFSSTNSKEAKHSGGKDITYAGGCLSRPTVPVNGNLSCSSDGGCRAACALGYRFPNGEHELAIVCHAAQWKIQGAEYSAVPHCEPICLPECQNNGICEAPNKCFCAENFSGPQCQFENNPCLNPPPMIRNAQSKCNSKRCTITCYEHFAFPDGSSVANMACKEGNWVPTGHRGWTSVPDCKAVCDPPCKNGGICLPLNTCQCPQDYRGPQCQYRSDTCTGSKLGFNGGFECGTKDENSYSCRLSCPDNVDFEFPPAAEYVCRYDSGGKFEPQPIPQCQPPEGSRLVSVEHSSFYTVTNHTWNIQGTSSFQANSAASALNHFGYSESTHGSSGIEIIKTGGGSESGSGMISGGIQENRATVGHNEMQRVERIPEAGSCFAWAGVHYKTFDGLIYSFQSSCAYTLLKDTRDGLFTITGQIDPSCRKSNITSSFDCPLVIRIYIQGKEYSLSRNYVTGMPEFRSTKKVMPIPSQLAHLRVEAAHAGQFLVVSLDAVGLKIKWDGSKMVQLEAAQSLWKRTDGLCGNMNGDKEDDFGEANKSILSLASKWRVEDIGEKCEEYPSHDNPCSTDPELERTASEFCEKLLLDPRFKHCDKYVDFAEIKATCQRDYCSCGANDRRHCSCDTVAVYVRQCVHKGQISVQGWRDIATCPMPCKNGKIYNSCGPRIQASCGASEQLSEHTIDSSNCEEGCFCPVNTVLHEGRCISPEECPCRLRGKSFAPGSVVPKDCNTCVCMKGQWTCTESKCGARCSAVGDPHYTTFDGKRYDFMGKCSYYLVKADNYSVEAENAACTSAISEMMGFTRTFQDGEPSCTKAVTIRINDVAIKLKQNHEILVNGEDVTKLPMLAGGARVRIVSSIFLGVELPNGLEVLWDGVSRVYVNAPAHFRGQTKGLCGTFTSNQKDDFLTPDGDVEQSVVPFANKWKTSEQCEDVKKESDHPCDLNPQKRAAAEKYCSALKKEFFLGCHWHVDPEPFYKDCLYDMCACEATVESCLCPTLAGYAKDCAQIGVIIPWRQQVQECQLHCPGDQEYQMCGSSCTRSCADISFHNECKEECVEGCNCPKGFTLDVNGDCIPIGQCPCSYGGLEFLAGYREVRPGTKGLELCTCAGGIWNCQIATPDEIHQYPTIANLKNMCSATRHQEVTTCEPAEPRTCRNMHQPISQSPAICRPGCVCKPGYVLDLPSGECVKQSECPCYHGGQSYKEGAVMQEECNTCKCSAGKWNCTNIVCPGICSVWGDSHYKTFDDRQFDFQGACDYVMAKGKLSDTESFDVSVRSVACGTTGITCSKSITLTVGKTGNGVNQESVTLTRGKSLSAENFKGLGRIAMRRAGLFVFLDVPDLGLVIQWDEGTRVYVRLDVKWKGRTKGLCGDFDDDAENDFKTPSGGVSEASAGLFADSWKMSELCAETTDQQTDTCAKHPERKLWATQRCRVMKSSLFEPCHSEVPPEAYIERCVLDACGCDDGGDCECLCTAIAAYAQECNARGVPIQWRSQKLCPIQCDETCSNYSPCVSTCPRETCDNLATRGDSLHLCDQDTCVEGCLPKPCPEGQIYLNGSYSECVPKADCRILCSVIDGVKYYEGDKLGGDECHSCFCSRGKIVCKGEPCAKTTIATTTTTTMAPTVTKPSSELGEQTKQCKSGWTSWFNRDLPKNDGFRSDIENIPTLIELLEIEGSPACEKDRMVDIQCRTVDGQVSYKDVGINVECSLENGLLCLPSKKPKQTCPDFEIRVLCRCESAPIVVPPTPSADLCQLTEPYRAVADNCFDFLQCSVGLNGNEWVQKTCGPGTMFNENLQVCDWPANVAVVRPECGENKKRKLVHHQCKDGEHWSECAIQCSKTCSYYNHILTKDGVCNKTVDCVPGCVPDDRVDCASSNYFWRDRHTCVDRSGCICKGDDGEPITPGFMVKVSECKSCQCINDYYTCDESACETNSVETVNYNVTMTNVTQTKQEIKTIIVPSTASPPAECPPENYIWLVESSPFETTYVASSFENSFVTPDSARLRRMNTFITWSPTTNDEQQWVEIHLAHPTPIYGVIVGGDAFDDKFVTSYHVLFSEDGNVFSYITDQRGDTSMPKVLSGPVDGSTPVRQIFHPPIEAKVVRINPITWHKGIAMQVELVGCGKNMVTTTTAAPVLTTPLITESIVQPMCDDPMGYDSYLMSDMQVFVSSAFSNFVPNMRISSTEIWRPLLDNPDQFVQIDFLEPRNLTGVATMGGYDSWVTAYKIYYGNDGKIWNPVLDEFGAEKVFLGNVDDFHIKINYFDKPIGARLMRIVPIKWHRHIGLKFEIHGCFLPYPPIALPPPVFPPPPPPPKPSECNVCTGVAVQGENTCMCEGSLWWDGRFCVTRQECPCVGEHGLYPVGSGYETPDCQHCLCALNGVPVCQPKICPPCNVPGERPVVTELCGCICLPCPAGTRLCPTSLTCIDESKWCNGVLDCPDDEENCVAVSVSANTNVVKQTIIKIQCQTSCPPGYTMENDNSVESNYDSVGSYANFNFSMEKTESIKTSFTKQIIKVKVPPPAKTFQSRMGGEEDQMCPKILCRPNIEKSNYLESTCEKIECPSGFQPKHDQSKSYRKTTICDNTCVPIPPKERVCNVIGRTFTTFDNLEYKYDVCNHILARDRDDNRWYIIVEKVCKDQNLSCLKTLVVKFDEHMVALHPDMYVVVDGSMYSASEVKHLGDKNPWMKLSRVGNALRIESRHYPVWAMLESDGTIKIGASEVLAGHVDGLCGFLDGLAANDQQTPEGNMAKSTKDFGDSWKVLDSAECKLKVCPKEAQEAAWKMCTLVRDASFGACDKALNRERFVSSCLENSCACLSSGNATDQECRCRALSAFVAECLAADKNVDLSSWRSVHDCPAVCDAPFVHKDCFRNKCEMSCENLQQLDPCPVMDGLCIPGCFCPDGFVRNGDTCIPPTECRDCVCNGLGNSKYVTFDKSNLLFDGNCTYVLSRDVLKISDGENKNHAYQVLVSNGACTEGICTEVITVMYQSHIVQIRKGKSQLVSIVDEEQINKYPHKTSWIKLEETQNGDINLLIPAIQLELISFKHNFAFMLRLPSHTFGGDMEGLCGNCNGKQEDDLKKHDGEFTKDAQEFGNSWLVKKLPASLNLNQEHCSGPTKRRDNECQEKPSANEYCEQLLQDEAFRRCHGLVDPLPYYMACKDTLCNGGTDGCANFEAYARMCSVAGICVDWRTDSLCPFHCPTHLLYRACESGCPETCENLNGEKQEKCTASQIEGCFCPSDQILRNGTCIHKRNCFVCDVEGHVDGDVWQLNKCTECTCQKRLMKCQETSCPAVQTVCDENSNAVVVPGTENDCCPKYLCVPNPTEAPACVETQQPECGYAQTLKTTIDKNGCQKFICQCVPESECPILDGIDIRGKDSGILEPGFVTITNTSGCCPRNEKICQPETCPPTNSCQKYSVPIVKVDPNACCPKIDCEPPKDLCLYYMDSSNGLEFLDNLIAKDIGETWEDGKCKTCTCELRDGIPTPNCVTKECLGNIEEHPDFRDFVLERVPVDNACCPLIKRVACKHNAHVYQPGQTWNPDPKDICVTTECATESDGLESVLTRKTIVQECPITCEFGYEYRPSSDRSITCCGECVPIACVYEGELKYIGETWQSEDYCWTRSCIAENGSLRVQVSKENCEIVDPSEEDNYKLDYQKVLGKCCPNIVRTACLSDGKYYQPGQNWQSSDDACDIESCIFTPEGRIVKQKASQTCNKDCAKGWEYQEPEFGTCCGECKQVYCVVDDLLYEPGTTWYSDDNCTAFSCSQKNDYLFISKSTPVCPELNCEPELMYDDGCCKKCNITSENKVEQACAAEVFDFEKTIGILVEKKGSHGICKNLKPIVGLTECHGHCNSSTHFNIKTWEQVVDCTCCKPVDYRKINVELTCEDGKKFKKILTVPSVCMCEGCASDNSEDMKRLHSFYDVKGHRKHGLNSINNR
ncbi:hemocytin [Nasonia vitripennis]|uniref:Hemocytin n=1 Tax=Nasonia vitripennis TaxID=7425 RepID=A0A7M7M7Y9_NASVI|nr:hemocytin [Nasonia vitripennis]